MKNTDEVHKRREDLVRGASFVVFPLLLMGYVWDGGLSLGGGMRIAVTVICGLCAFVGAGCVLGTLVSDP